MSKVVVIGAGWLGLPLAKELKAQGHDVLATKRNEAECQHLTEIEGLHIVPFQLGQRLPEKLHKADVYVINIAAGRNNIDKDLFAADMQVLFQSCLMYSAKLLFVSTTSVYGESERDVVETSEPQPITDSAIAHVILENWLRKHAGEKVTILRLAGLLGEDRNPVHHFAGQQNITAANKVVNFVHRDDVISAISTVIRDGLWGQTLHLCSTEHPTRMAYYKWAAEQLHLAEPHFFDESAQGNSGKKIDASETIQRLGLTLKYPSPFMMIPGATPPVSTVEDNA